jgi:hypothetical protein
VGGRRGERGREKGGDFGGKNCFKLPKPLPVASIPGFVFYSTKPKKKGSTNRRHSQWYFEANMFENKTKQMKVHSWKGATI